MKYLGIEPKRPRIAVFDFTGCEGCELQLANREETAADFLRAIEVVSFREISSAHSDDYEIALIDGAITRGDEVERLKAIRERAKVLVALGSCACFGGVTRLKNASRRSSPWIWRFRVVRCPRKRSSASSST
jgi:coenzyme F420-reducing hydrogenase gamma subunit